MSMGAENLVGIGKKRRRLADRGFVPAGSKTSQSFGGKGFVAT
jgi:hypothetical protein